MNNSWIKIDISNPFRVKYLYWDIEKGQIGKREFKNKNLQIRFKKFLKNEDYNFTCVIITGWRNDQQKIEETLNKIDKQLKIINSNYGEFLKKWKSRNL